MSRPARQSDCHPETRHFAKGMCKRCYYKANKRGPKSDAAKARDVVYMASWRAANPEKVQQYYDKRGRDSANTAHRRWCAANPERSREMAKKNERLRIAADPEGYRETTRRNHLRKYGLTPADYAFMLHAQDGVCKICLGDNGTRRLAVDHCHVTGTVRGLLCGSCNTAVGWAEKRRADIHLALAEYVRVAVLIREGSK